MKQSSGAVREGTACSCHSSRLNLRARPGEGQTRADCATYSVNTAAMAVLPLQNHI